jgi:serine/threonine-protein kinase
MLAGQPPFRGDTALSVALQHVRTQPERLENLRSDIPPAV